MPPNFNEGYDGQWNLTTDQEIARNWVVSVSYIGNHGTHLFLSRDINYALLSSHKPMETLNENIATENQRRLFAFDGNCGTAPGGGALPCLGQTQEEANQGWSNCDALI